MLREVFAGELQCNKIKVGEETFTDLLLLQEHRKCKEEAEGSPVPIEAHGCCGALCLLWLPLSAPGSHVGLPAKWWDCPSYPQSWSKRVQSWRSPCQCTDFTKKKTPVKIDEGLWIAGCEYEAKTLQVDTIMLRRLRERDQSPCPVETVDGALWMTPRSRSLTSPRSREASE